MSSYHLSQLDNREQLEDAQENCRVACVQVDLLHGDARNLQHLADGSIDKIISCPPFGRQFSKESEDSNGNDLYGELLLEWSRVLKDTGRMVLLVDASNLLFMKEAIEKANCHVDFQRAPFRLGKLRGTFLVVSKTKTFSARKEGLFDFEVGQARGRALWAELRSQALPSLVPYSRTLPFSTS